MTQPNPCPWCDGKREPGELCACTPCPSCEDDGALYVPAPGGHHVLACPCTRLGWTEFLPRSATPKQIDEAMERMRERVRDG